MSNYYIYGHYVPGSDFPFYIGKGVKRRAYATKGRNWKWKKIAKEHGYRVEIMYIDLTKELANILEVELIQKYGRQDKGCGTLVNLTDGGDGREEGHTVSESTKETLRKQKLGVKHSPERCLQNSLALKAYFAKKREAGEKHPLAGTKQSAETSLKKSKALRGKSRKRMS